MATITSDSISHAASRKRESRVFAGLKSFWRDFFVRAFHPYRPELHYMRGPKPKVARKHREAVGEDEL